MAALRSLEVDSIRSTQLTSAVLQFLVISLPSLVCVATFGVFTVVFNGVVTPSRAFTSLALLGLLSAPLSQFPTILSSLLGMLVSAQRINRFLHAEEFVETLLLPQHDEDNDDDDKNEDGDDDNGKATDRSRGQWRSSSGDGQDEKDGDDNEAKGPHSPPPIAEGVLQPLYSLIATTACAQTPLISTARKHKDGGGDDDEDEDETDDAYARRWRARRRQRKRYLRAGVDPTKKAELALSSILPSSSFSSPSSAVWDRTAAALLDLPADNHRVTEVSIVIRKAHFTWPVGASQKEKGGGKGGGIGHRQGNRTRVEKEVQDHPGRVPITVQQRQQEQQQKPQQTQQPVLSDVSLVVPRGSLVAVVGRVGSGKSSLLAAILNELECSTTPGRECGGGRSAKKIQGKVALFGSVAYCAQVSISAR